MSAFLFLNTMDHLNFIIISAELIGIIALAVLYIKSRYPSQTIEQQNLLIESLQRRIEDLEKGHHDNEKIISGLTGELRVYKEIPLQQIANSLQTLESLPSKLEKALASK